MVDYNKYSLRTLPSVHYGRMNIWNRYECRENAARDHFYATVPPYRSQLFGFPGCGFPITPIATLVPPTPVYCGLGSFFNGVLLGNVIGQSVASCVNFFRNIFC